MAAVELEQRLSELENAERMYRQRNADTKPSRQELERAQNEAEEKTRGATRALFRKAE